MTSSTFNGWANWETWNASLWIGNDEFLYDTAKACVRFCTIDDTPYEAFIRCMTDMEMFTTGDDLRWDDNGIDHDEMNEMMEEL